MRSALRTVASRLLPQQQTAAPAATRLAHYGQSGNWQKPTTLDVPVPGDAKTRTVTVIPGDGVGPLVVGAAQAAIAATGPWHRACCTTHHTQNACRRFHLLRMVPATRGQILVPFGCAESVVNCAFCRCPNRVGVVQPERHGGHARVRHYRAQGGDGLHRPE